MKPKLTRRLWWDTLLVSLLMIAGTVVGYYAHNQSVFYLQLAVGLAALLYIWVRHWNFRRTIKQHLSLISAKLNIAERRSLQSFPVPVVAFTDKGEVAWYSPSFEKDVLKGENGYNLTMDELCGGLPVSFFQKQTTQLVRLDNRFYKVYSQPVEDKSTPLTLLYYLDDTEHQETMEEYAQSRPVVMAFYIDNVEELMQSTRDSERAQLISRVETLLEDWVTARKGIVRRFSNERFLVVIEQRYMDAIINERFSILDQVRAVQTSGGTSLTLSIGVGNGNTFAEGETTARQALEMALGRGGDQAAVKTGNGYDFYGGVSKGVERRARVRTRVIASALVDLIAESQNVLVMGHRFSDLDCLGAAAGMVSIVRSLGKLAWVVCDRQTTLAGELLDRYESEGKTDIFIQPDKALNILSDQTLLIITDTHNPLMLENGDLYRQAKTVVVIDHHRKMVNHIDNAVIFYHEPNASSASEMVTELAQYMGEKNLARLDAEALLAGIMLDTRSFVMKAGVRTFEAAAYLRRIGADTVEVKRLFASSMLVYRLKADIISSAEQYNGTIVAVCREPGSKETRIAAAQAADELLSIKGAKASFTLFADGTSVNISARSLGDFNVQLVMEKLGGGGHMTMAGASLKETSLSDAIGILRRAIDQYLQEHSSK